LKDAAIPAIGPALARGAIVPVPATREDAGRPLSLTFTLRRSDEPGFRRLVRAVTDPRSRQYRHFLSQRVLTRRFGPARASYRAVRTWLRRSGFRHVHGSANRLTITATAARADVERALRLDPESPVTLRLRGILRNNTGDYAGALADYEAAHAIAPRPDDPFVIGSTQFLQHQFGTAAATLATRTPPAPDGTYWRLWRYMALARLTGIERANGSLGPGTPPGAGAPWPGPVVDFFHGTIDAATLLEAARKSQEAQDLSQVCEATFYMGEDALLRQHGDFFGLFRQAVKDCPINFHEYEGAVAELRAAGVPSEVPATAAPVAAPLPAPVASGAR
jgi:lipoprotein NlpI